MKGATHFIEVYKGNDRVLYSPGLLPINKLKSSIKMTKDSPSLKTIAVMFFKPKASIVIASRDNNAGIILIEPATA